MRLTDEQRARILRELEALDYGRLIITVCAPKGHLTLTVERQVRIDTTTQLTQPTKVP